MTFFHLYAAAVLLLAIGAFLCWFAHHLSKTTPEEG